MITVVGNEIRWRGEKVAVLKTNKVSASLIHEFTEAITHQVDVGALELDLDQSERLVDDLRQQINNLEGRLA